MTSRTAKASILCVSGALLCAATVQASPPIFTDQTASAGVTCSHTFVFPGPFFKMIAGGAVGDFNNDGFQDLFVVAGGLTPDLLYINNGNGTFTDQATAWGVDEPHQGCAAATGDFDGDGWLDIYVTSWGLTADNAAAGKNRLYHNNGDNTFTDVAASAGVAMTDPDGPNGLGAAFGDYDLDGDLDLFITAWFADGAFGGPLMTAGNRLFQNNGDGTFTDSTVTAGVDCPLVHGFAPTFADMNGDRYPELMITGDFQTTRYFTNNGDGTFTDNSVLAGVSPDPTTNAMGMAVGDFNNDGLFDWYVTSINVNALYLNMGGDTYTEMAGPAGVQLGNWGWGSLFGDYNNDGFLDIAETNGFCEDASCSPCPCTPSHLWINNGDLTFTDMFAASGFDHTAPGKGMSNIDYDNDGDLDVVIFSYDSAMQLFRNDTTGADTNWLRLFFDTQANGRLAPNGFGVKVTATTGGISRHAQITGECNYQSVSEFSAHFGLGSSTVIDELLIEWPNGVVTTMNNVAANQNMTIVAGAPGDCNGDGAIDTADLGILIAAFGSSTLIADINGDGTVDTADLGQLIANFGS